MEKRPHDATRSCLVSLLLQDLEGVPFKEHKFDPLPVAIPPCGTYLRIDCLICAPCLVSCASSWIWKVGLLQNMRYGKEASLVQRNSVLCVLSRRQPTPHIDTPVERWDTNQHHCNVFNAVLAKLTEFSTQIASIEFFLCLLLR